MENLKEQLKLHKDWLQDNNTGKRLDLSGANLRYANLRYANLRYANLRYANLSGADLSGADLRYANLSDANLSGANLSGADLSGADLRYANLSGANLRYANLSGANLRYANLRYANLRYCIGNSKEVKSLQIGTYIVSYTNYILNIGCQSHNHLEWKSFHDDDILGMEGEKALDWWHLNRHIIFELIDREAYNENN